MDCTTADDAPTQLRHRVFISMLARSDPSTPVIARLPSPIVSVKFVTLVRQHDPRCLPVYTLCVLDGTISRKRSPKSVCVAEDRHGHGHVRGMAWLCHCCQDRYDPTFYLAHLGRSLREQTDMPHYRRGTRRKKLIHPPER